MAAAAFMTIIAVIVTAVAVTAVAAVIPYCY